MKTKTKVIISIIAVLLSAALITTIILLSYGDGIRAKIRNIKIENNGIDVKSTLSSFDNISYSQVGSTTNFEGSKNIDLNDFSNIENLAASTEDLKELEKLKNAKVTYKCSYNSDSNSLTLSFKPQFEDGSFESEELSGVGFINEQHEIDAVLNIDGEAVLLSELRNTDILDNNAVGAIWWGFSRFLGFLSKAIPHPVVQVAVVAVAAVVAVTVAVVSVVTMAQNVGNSNTNTGGNPTNKPIDSYTTIDAAIEAEVNITIDMWRNFFPSIEFETTTFPNVENPAVEVKAINAKIKSLADLKEIAKVVAAENGKKPPKEKRPFMQAYVNQGVTTGIYKVQVEPRYTQNEMSNYMVTSSWNSYTEKAADAKAVIVQAFTQLGQIRNIEYEYFLHQKRLYHYHARDKADEINRGGAGGLAGGTVHSYCLQQPLEEPEDKANNNTNNTLYLNNQSYIKVRRRKLYA